MLGKKSHAARPGDVGAGLVVARPLVAMKTVLRTGIDENLDVGPFCPDGLDIAERNAGILFAEMQLRRHFRLVVPQPAHAPPSIPHPPPPAAAWGRGKRWHDRRAVENCAKPAVCGLFPWVIHLVEG